MKSRKIIDAIPPGFLEEPKEFLVSAALVFTGLVVFLIPALTDPGEFHRLAIPYALIVIWGFFFFVGGILTCVGLLIRGMRFRLIPRMLESIGLSLLAAATLSYVVVGFAKNIGGNAPSLLIILALGLGFAVKVAILFPGIYETILMNEVDREVKKIVRSG